MSKRKSPNLIAAALTSDGRFRVAVEWTRFESASYFVSDAERLDDLEMPDVVVIAGDALATVRDALAAIRGLVSLGVDRVDAARDVVDLVGRLVADRRRRPDRRYVHVPA